MTARARFIGSAVFLVALCVAAVLRLVQLRVGAPIAPVLGWLILTTLAVSGVGLLVALVMDGERTMRADLDTDPWVRAEQNYRGLSLRSDRLPARQRP